MNERFNNVGFVPGRLIWRFQRITVAAILLIWLSEKSARSAIVPVDQLVAGKSSGEWVVAFWKWFIETPYDSRHPANDYSGAHALNGQSGSVWFLLAASTKQPITRNISIPDDKYLFVGLDGTSCSNVDKPPFYGGDEAEMRACAEGFPGVDLFFEIDGEPVRDLENFRVTSPMFDFVLPPVNASGVTGGGPGQGVASGIHLMIAPLSPGNHSIHFRVAVPEVNFSADVTYRITVYARPVISIRPLPGTGQMELSWPSTEGFSLQSAEKLGSNASWSSASVLSSAVADGIQAVTVTNSAARYFRLLRL